MEQIYAGLQFPTLDIAARYHAFKNHLMHLGGNYSLQNLHTALRTPLWDMHIKPAPLHLTQHNWYAARQNYTYRGEEKHTHVYIAHAKNPRAIIFYSLGWKVKPKEQEETIAFFQSQGFTVVTLPLVEPLGAKIGTVEESIARLQKILFDPDSVLHTLSEKILPVLVMSHSASSNAFLHAAKRALKKDSNAELIQGVFHVAPFFDSANSSALAFPRFERFYKKHARRYHDHPAGTPPEDRAYYFLNGVAKQLQEDPHTRPTHGQVLELKFYGQDIYNDSWFETAENLPPQTYVISKNDPFSCYHTSLQIAQKMKDAKIITCEAGHGPQDNAEIREQLAKLMHEVVS